MRDEVREKVGQNSKQRESRNTVSRENPSSAAFMVPDGGSRRRTRISRSDDWGPIFHAKCLRRKDRGASTLCVTPAPRHGEARLSEQNFTPNPGRRIRKK